MATWRGLTQGRTYTRTQIRRQVGGGGLRDFLPHCGGRVVAVCLDPKRNLGAPEKADVGPGPQRVRWSRVAAEQVEALPVFLKRAANAWEYVGRFVPTRYAEAGRELERGRQRRASTVGVLCLRKARR